MSCRTCQHLTTSDLQAFTHSCHFLLKNPPPSAHKQRLPAPNAARSQQEAAQQEATPPHATCCGAFMWRDTLQAAFAIATLQWDYHLSDWESPPCIPGGYGQPQPPSPNNFVRPKPRCHKIALLTCEDTGSGAEVLPEPHRAQHARLRHSR